MSRIHGFTRNLFINASGPAVSTPFPWQGGRLEMLVHGTTFGGQGVGGELMAPDGVWVPVTEMFIKTNGMISGILCPGLFRGTLSVGATGISAWVVGIIE